jgi:hypothetical protein
MVNLFKAATTAARLVRCTLTGHLLTSFSLIIVHRTINVNDFFALHKSIFRLNRG